MGKKAKKDKKEAPPPSTEENKEEKVEVEVEEPKEEVHSTTESADDEPAEPPAAEDQQEVAPPPIEEDPPPAPTLDKLPKVPKKDASIPKPDGKLIASFAGQEIEIDSNMAKTPNGARFHVPASVAESAKQRAQEEIETIERRFR